MRFEDHPTVKRSLLKTATPQSHILDAAWLRKLVMEAGADDVGFVEIGRAALDDERAHILQAFPATKALISFVVRMNREAVRTPARSVSNSEFHHSGNEVNHVSRQVVQALEDLGIRALNPAMGFPMEMDKFPGRAWVVSHKLVAVAAGLGMMGIHRNLIHEKFGNFVLLGTILLDAEVTESTRPIDYNPCLECKLCVAACPVGAISPEGDFNFSSCYTHNYREFMGGFTDWAEQVADSKSSHDYRSRVSDSESASMWQSLSYGANYKAAYCLAVCPAGEDVIGPFLNDKKAHLKEVVRPLQDKEEIIYVTRNSDAEDHVARRFPHKKIKHVGNTLRPTSIEGFLNGMPNVFQPGKSAGLNAIYHFTFTGLEQRQATVVINNKKIWVKEGHVGSADLQVTADSQTWVGFLREEKNLMWALVRRKIRLIGSPRLLVAFGKCFPSLGGRQQRVEILPQPSPLLGKPTRYRRNDAATGKVRWQGKLRLFEVVDEAHGVKTFRFRLPGGGPIPFEYLPGQYVTLHLAAGKRSYTIASTPTCSDWIEITVKREQQGVVSRWLHDQLQIGDEIEVEGPNGNFVFSGREADRVVLIGGGVGITPLMSAVRYLDATAWPGKIQLILSFRSPRDFLFQDELSALQARNPNLAVTVTMSRPQEQPWSGRVGRIDAGLLAATVPELFDHRVHICGPSTMMDEVKSALVSLGVPGSEIKTEAFGTARREPSASSAVAGKVCFTASQVIVPVAADQTLLEAAEAAGVSIDSDCRSGTCASCRVKLISGRVSMQVEDGLSDQDREDGYILACQAMPLGDLEVDA